MIEKKTMGNFLAALRKANGYTQQDIAEKLGVSNKTLSSWETDKTCPDLTLIPVLADLYGVTADEILRGERRKAEARQAAAETEPRPNADEPTARAVRAVLKKQSETYKGRNEILRGGAVGAWLFVAVGLLLLFFVNLTAGIILCVLGAVGFIVVVAALQVVSVKAVSFADEQSEGTREIVSLYLRKLSAIKDVTRLVLLAPLLLIATVLPFCFVSFAFQPDKSPAGGPSNSGSVGLGQLTPTSFSVAAVLCVVIGLGLLFGAALWWERRRAADGAGEQAYRDNRRLLCKTFLGAAVPCLVSLVLVVLSAVSGLFVHGERLYAAADRAEMQTYLQTVVFDPSDAPVREGVVQADADGVYRKYFDIAEEMETLAGETPTGDKREIALGDGFLLSVSGYRATHGASSPTYAITLGYHTAEGVFGTIVPKILYLEEADAYLLRDTNYPGTDVFVRVRDGQYQLYGITAYASVVCGLSLLVGGLCAPVALALYAIRRKRAL